VWTEDVEELKAEDEEDENGSRKPVTADDEILELFKENGVSMTKLQLELLLNHLDKEDDGKVDAQDLENIKINAEDPLSIVQSVIASFNRLDKNQDGKISEVIYLEMVNISIHIQKLLIH
jgi:Ca2+-binding EF-hand superfamily protein